MYSDKQLINMLLSNDIDTVYLGFEYLYNKYHKLVFHCINKIIGNINDTEELVNDTFLKIFNNRKKLIENKNVKYYIIQTGKNLSVDFLRRNNKEDIIYEDRYFNNIKQTDNNEKLISFEEVLKKLSDTLNEKEIDVVVSHLFEGLSFKQIASKNNEKTSKVSNIYYRALDKVKERRDINEK